MEKWYKLLKSTWLTVLYLSFEFHGNSIFISRPKNWIVLFTISEIGILHKQILTIGAWPLSITVTRHFRPKSDDSNERIYCKQIDREIKNTIQGAVAGFLTSTIPELWKILKNQFCCVLDKKKKEKRKTYIQVDLKKLFVVERSFTLPSVPKKCSFECNGFKAVIRYIYIAKGTSRTL